MRRGRNSQSAHNDTHTHRERETEADGQRDRACTERLTNSDALQVDQRLALIVAFENARRDLRNVFALQPNKPMEWIARKHSGWRRSGTDASAAKDRSWAWDKPEHHTSVGFARDIKRIGLVLGKQAEKVQQAQVQLLSLLREWKSMQRSTRERERAREMEKEDERR